MKQINTVEFEKKFENNGYISIFVNKWILEHRYVTEQFIGRKLKDSEKVHHINNIKTDNRIENLIIFKSNKDHAHFHSQLKQFGMTRPRLTQIEALKLLMLIEREKNLKEVII